MSETPQNPGPEATPEPGQTPPSPYGGPSGTPAGSGGAAPQPGPAQPEGQQPGAAQQPYGGQPYGQPGAPGTPPPGQQPYPGQAPGYAAPPLRPDEERTWALLAHLSGIVLCIIAPLVVWLVFKERSRFVDAEAKEALNFQITLVIASIPALVLAIILPFLPFLVFAAGVVFMILAAVETSKGRPYRYPVTLRLVK